MQGEKEKTMEIIIKCSDDCRGRKDICGYIYINHIQELVRCKDCRYWEEPNEYGFADCTMNYGLRWGANHFCSYGERKSDE